MIADWVTYDNDLNELPKLSMLLLSYARATGPKYLIHVIQEKSMIRKAKPCELSCPDARERAGPVGEEEVHRPRPTRASGQQGQRVKLVKLTVIYLAKSTILI